MQYLNEPELKRLLEAIPNPRNRLMVLVAFWHGLRASEVTQLRGRDIRSGHIYVERLKGSLTTTQIYQHHVDPLLDERRYLTAIEPTIKDNQLVFPMTRFGLYKLMRRAAVKAGLGARYKKVRPHILKHSIIKQSLNGGANIHYVKRWAGHKNLASTAHYINVDDQEAGLAIGQAMRKAS